MAEKKIKLLASDLTELIDLHPAQARKLQKSGLVTKIPSNSELILKLLSKNERNWPLSFMPDDLLKMVSERVSGNLSSVDLEKSVKFPLTADIMSELFAEIELHNECVLACLVRPKAYAEFRKWGRDVLDLIENPTVFSKGILSILWSSAIICRANLFPKDCDESIQMFVLSQTRRIIVRSK